MQPVQTPYGTLEWSGDLAEKTPVTITRDGASTVVPLERIISMTNGAVLPYLPGSEPTPVAASVAPRDLRRELARRRVRRAH